MPDQPILSHHEEQLRRWGWDDFFAACFQEHQAAGYVPARVTLEYNQFHRVQIGASDLLAEVAGRLKHAASSRAELPAVGDWVALRPAGQHGKPVINAVLPRRSKFARKTKGAKTEEQIVGANIDTLFLVTSLNQDFNPRRVERYLAIAWESGARPVILLTKTDLCPNVAALRDAIETVAQATPIHAICSLTGAGLEELQQYFYEGQTVALIGSSGVGKSTLINRLLGHEQQKVKAVRTHDERGQHATRHRELILLPTGGLVLDTPGMRELQLWGAEEGIETTFEDIEELAAQCQFSDCQHQTEPRCQVRQALADGTLAPERFENYRKMQQELAYLVRRQDALVQHTERNRWKKLSRMAEERAKWKRGGK